MGQVLKTDALTKAINNKVIISNVNMSINEGEIYGFLGPNGAGKTSVMKMLTNLWKPTSGNIEIFGEIQTPYSYKNLKRMGSIIEFPAFFDSLSGIENLELHCKYMGYNQRGDCKEILKLFELEKASEKPVKSYSLGMKQRLGIARAILTRHSFREKYNY